MPKPPQGTLLRRGSKLLPAGNSEYLVHTHVPGPITSLRPKQMNDDGRRACLVYKHNGHRHSFV